MGRKPKGGTSDALSPSPEKVSRFPSPATKKGNKKHKKSKEDLAAELRRAAAEAATLGAKKAQREELQHNRDPSPQKKLKKKDKKLHRKASRSRDHVQVEEAQPRRLDHEVTLKSRRVAEKEKRAARCMAAEDLAGQSHVSEDDDNAFAQVQVPKTKSSKKHKTEQEEPPPQKKKDKKKVKATQNESDAEELPSKKKQKKSKHKEKKAKEKKAISDEEQEESEVTRSKKRKKDKKKETWQEQKSIK